MNNKSMLLSAAFCISLSILAEEKANFENNPVLQALENQKKPVVETAKQSNTPNPVKEIETNLSWIKDKSDSTKNNIIEAIKRGDFAELKNYQKSRIEDAFNEQENVEEDELISCMAQAIKLQNGPNKLRLLEEFEKYCKSNEIPFYLHLDKQDAEIIKLLALIEFKKDALKNFTLGFTIDSEISESIISQLNTKKVRYCNPNFKKAFRTECNLCNEFEEIIKKMGKK